MTSLFFEDLAVGDMFTAPGRTITETDLTMFSMISGDWSPIHADAPFASETRFGQRIMHGPFGVAFALGAFSRLSQFADSAIALLNIREWDFKAPIFVGDTLRLEFAITATRLTSSKTTGVIDRQMWLLKDGEVIAQTGFMGLLIGCRPQQ